jgi:Transposase domain (DUF772)
LGHHELSHQTEDIGGDGGIRAVHEEDAARDIFGRGELCALIAPHYPKPGKGRRPKELEQMVRIYFLQQWFNLADPAAEEALTTR